MKKYLDILYMIILFGLSYSVYTASTTTKNDHDNYWFLLYIPLGVFIVALGFKMLKDFRIRNHEIKIHKNNNYIKDDFTRK